MSARLFFLLRSIFGLYFILALLQLLFILYIYIFFSLKVFLGSLSYFCGLSGSVNGFIYSTIIIFFIPARDHSGSVLAAAAAIAITVPGVITRLRCMGEDRHPLRRHTITITTCSSNQKTIIGIIKQHLHHHRRKIRDRLTCPFRLFRLRFSAITILMNQTGPSSIVMMKMKTCLKKVKIIFNKSDF